MYIYMYILMYLYVYLFIVEQATSLCSCNMHSYSAVEHVSCATMAVLRQHAHHLFLSLWGR